MSQMDNTEAKIADFAHERRRVRRRIEQLESLFVQAGVSGGTLTLNLEALQDGLLNIHVEPEVLLPYIATELEAERVRLKKLDAKARQLMEIINY